MQQCFALPGSSDLILSVCFASILLPRSSPGPSCAKALLWEESLVTCGTLSIPSKSTVYTPPSRPPGSPASGASPWTWESHSVLTAPGRVHASHTDPWPGQRFCASADALTTFPDLLNYMFSSGIMNSSLNNHIRKVLAHARRKSK